MKNVGGSEKRSIISDPNFNFFAMSDGQREGSLAYSDISFPSHVSELESFQSELDISLNSHDSTSTAGHKLPESGIGFESSTQNNLEGDDREKERYCTELLCIPKDILLLKLQTCSLFTLLKVRL